MPNAIGRAIVLVFMVVVSSGELVAHPVPYSYVNVDVRQSAFDVSLVLHICDVAHDLNVVPMERLLDSSVVRDDDSALRKLFIPRFTLEVDGRRLEPEWLPTDILADRQSLQLN